MAWSAYCVVHISVWVLVYVYMCRKFSYPLSRIQVQVLDLPVLEETGQADAVVREVRLVAYDYDVVLVGSCV